VPRQEEQLDERGAQSLQQPEKGLFEVKEGEGGGIVTAERDDLVQVLMKQRGQRFAALRNMEFVAP
jgi:hypothetical protein